MSHHRPERVADLVHAEISRILREEVADPRLRALSITGVHLTPDLKTARVRVVLLGGEGDPRPLMRGLTRANGYIRRLLARNLRLRYTPALDFSYDHQFEDAVRMTDLLGSLETAPVGEE